MQLASVCMASHEEAWWGHDARSEGLIVSLPMGALPAGLPRAPASWRLDGLVRRMPRVRRFRILSIVHSRKGERRAGIRSD